MNQSLPACRRTSVHQPHKVNKCKKAGHGHCDGFRDQRFREHFTKGTLSRPLVISCLEDADHFDEPGSRMGEAVIMGLYAEQLQAELQLYHPKHPDPWPLFIWWRKAEHDQDHPLRHIQSRGLMVGLKNTCRDLQVVLRHQGNHEEAKWLEGLLFEVFPPDKEFLGKSRRKRLSVDGKPLPSLRLPEEQ